MNALRIDQIENWILVTGMIRSGTTFLGKILSLPREVDYLHEPFNGGRSRASDKPFEARYIRPSESDLHEDYCDEVSNIFQYDIKFKTFFHEGDPLHKKLFKYLFGSRGPIYLNIAKLNIFHKYCIIKDPVCKISTEYLYNTFDVYPVIMVRHPLSLAASLKRVGWFPDMNDFRDEPDLVADYFQEDTAFIHRSWESPLLEAMAHWRATYKVLLAQGQQYPDWQFVRLEDLSENPIQVSQRIYRNLGLPWSHRIESRIRNLTKPKNTTEASNNQAMDLKRNSRAIFARRRDSIEQADRHRIFHIVEDVARKLYSEESFAL
jgi:hypothetical protein